MGAKPVEFHEPAKVSLKNISLRPLCIFKEIFSPV